MANRFHVLVSIEYTSLFVMSVLPIVLLICTPSLGQLAESFPFITRMNVFFVFIAAYMGTVYVWSKSFGRLKKKYSASGQTGRLSTGFIRKTALRVRRVMIWYRERKTKIQAIALCLVGGLLIIEIVIERSSPRTPIAIPETWNNPFFVMSVIIGMMAGLGLTFWFLDQVYREAIAPSRPSEEEIEQVMTQIHSDKEVSPMEVERWAWQSTAEPHPVSRTRSLAGLAPLVLSLALLEFIDLGFLPPQAMVPISLCLAAYTLVMALYMEVRGRAKHNSKKTRLMEEIEHHESA